MRRNTPGSRPSGRGRRGYTIVEIALVSALSSILILIALRWVGGITTVTIGGMEDAQSQRARSVILVVEEDLRRAQHCDPSGLDSPLVSVTSDAVTVLADSDADGDVEKITWRLSGSYVERAVLADQGNCVFAAPDENDWRRVLSGVSDATFTAVSGGSRDNDGSLYGTCESPEDLVCAVQAVELHLVTQNGAELNHVMRISG